ncbi:preprotein translocase subunit SecE [Candidatus Collierbacteria bacterium]|nr:preprotein translocase subunit SecE [Candidatus Collierbacteria bacterium]
MSDKKTGFTGPVEFIREVLVELASVKWPTRQETIRLTVLVILVSLFVALYIGGLDLAFTSLVSRIINR